MKWKIFIVCFLIVYSVAFLGGLFTDVDSGWYDLVKPSITPPNYIFPIVWNILFFLIALSLYLAWIKSKKIQKRKIAFVFGINLLLNFFWSVLFFGLKKSPLAFAELIVLWMSILLMILTTYKIDKKSSYLLIPYLLWVSFAGVLNWMIAFQN